MTFYLFRVLTIAILVLFRKVTFNIFKKQQLVFFYSYKHHEKSRSRLHQINFTKWCELCLLLIEIMHIHQHWWFVENRKLSIVLTLTVRAGLFVAPKAIGNYPRSDNDTSWKRAQRSLSLPPKGGGIIRSKIFRALRFGKSRLIKFVPLDS